MHRRRSIETDAGVSGGMSFISEENENWIVWMNSMSMYVKRFGDKDNLKIIYMKTHSEVLNFNWDDDDDDDGNDETLFLLLSPWSRETVHSWSNWNEVCRFVCIQM